MMHRYFNITLLDEVSEQADHRAPGVAPRPSVRSFTFEKFKLWSPLWFVVMS